MNTEFSKYPKLQNLKTEWIPIQKSLNHLILRKENRMKSNSKQEKFKGKILLNV